jgi:hypothetical protein
MTNNTCFVDDFEYIARFRFVQVGEGKRLKRVSHSGESTKFLQSLLRSGKIGQLHLCVLA